MRPRIPHELGAAVLAACGLLACAGAEAQNRAEGKLEVNARPVPISQAYAYATEGFFDKSKLDVVVLLCDAPLPAAALRDTFARKALAGEGKVRCVKQVVNSERQVINFEVLDKGFGARPPSGGSTEHVFEAATFDGKTIAGRARTKSMLSSFDDIPYRYDISFSAAIEPKK